MFSWLHSEFIHSFWMQTRTTRYYNTIWAVIVFQSGFHLEGARSDCPSPIVWLLTTLWYWLHVYIVLFHYPINLCDFMSVFAMWKCGTFQNATLLSCIVLRLETEQLQWYYWLERSWRTVSHSWRTMYIHRSSFVDSGKQHSWRCRTFKKWLSVWRRTILRECRHSVVDGILCTLPLS